MDEPDSIYTIEYLMSGKWITTHIHNLRPFIYNPIRTNPLTVAQHNEQEFIVESILGHRCDRNRRSTLMIRVRWSGFDDSSDHSAEKQATICTQINKLLELGVIEKSQVSEWSQAHTVPKSDGQWRLTIDFVQLNGATKGLEGLLQTY